MDATRERIAKLDRRAASALCVTVQPYKVRRLVNLR
tara:strand:- start:3559 stop:3666 length:108 start_codon:yes stop_codon:yes gene_type:complete